MIGAMAVLLLGLAAAYGRRRFLGAGPRGHQTGRSEATASEPGDRHHFVALRRSRRAGKYRSISKADTYTPLT